MQLIALSFLLGIKHSFDADHLIAVSNYLTKSNSLKHSFRISLYWAAGHMLTASVITILLYSIREEFLKSYLSYFEIIVAIMLLVIGLYSVLDISVRKYLGKSHDHRYSGDHDNSSIRHHHKYLFGIGVIHGLASNDELLLLLTLSLGITTLWGMLAGVAVFSIGVIVGMCIFSCVGTAALFKLSRNNWIVTRSMIIYMAGFSSIFYGLYLLYK